MARPAATPPRTALVAGATGLIGQALLAQLLDDDRYGRVEVVARRPLTSALARHPRLAVRIGDAAALAGEEPRADDVYIALGTTIKVAGSEAAFRAVDFDLVVAIARAARARRRDAGSASSRRWAPMPRSLVFYNRVKGEMEAAVRALGYSVGRDRPAVAAARRPRRARPADAARRGLGGAPARPGAAAGSGRRAADRRGGGRRGADRQRSPTRPALRVLSSAEMQRFGRADRAQPSPRFIFSRTRASLPRDFHAASC